MQGCPIYNANIDNLAERIMELIADKNLRISLGKKGIDYVNTHLHPDKIYQKIINLYTN
jgi:glycosyltransferase involved in cell wall biosynthesis